MSRSRALNILSFLFVGPLKRVDKLEEGGNYYSLLYLFTQINNSLNLAKKYIIVNKPIMYFLRFG